jgi:hypothetical protein
MREVRAVKGSERAEAGKYVFPARFGLIWSIFDRTGAILVSSSVYRSQHYEGLVL